MSRLHHSIPIALLCGASLLLAGCSTSTKMKLSGSPGSTFSGQYRAGSSSFDVSGAVPFVVEVPSTSLEECLFLKTDPEKILTLEIRRGKTQFLEVSAQPGTLGIRARDDDGWHYQILK